MKRALRSIKRSLRSPSRARQKGMGHNFTQQQTQCFTPFRQKALPFVCLQTLSEIVAIEEIMNEIK